MAITKRRIALSLKAAQGTIRWMPAARQMHAVTDNRVNFPCRVVTPYACVPSEIAFLCIGGCHGGERAGGCDSICAGISSKILIAFEPGHPL